MDQPEDPRLAPLREILADACHVTYITCPHCGCKTAVQGLPCPSCDEDAEVS